MRVHEPNCNKRQRFASNSWFEFSGAMRKIKKPPNSMARTQSTGECEHCDKQFGYFLIHSGFADSVYAYCGFCGRTAVLSIYDKRMRGIGGCAPYQEICASVEPFLEPCECGGTFKKGASPRCPHCKKPLSAERATAYIERNVVAKNPVWRWQRNWNGLYCIVIEGQEVTDNFKIVRMG